MTSPSLKDSALYLERLGYAAAPPPTLETLRQLVQRHTQTFSFETINTFLHLPVPVDLSSLERKLLHDGRGGYCYELNHLFLALLHHLGFDARALTGRVVMGGPEDAITARTHLVVLVTVDGAPYIADVGFGGMVPTAPLRLDTEAVQSTPHEPYRIIRQGEAFLLSAEVTGEWRAMYRFDLQPQELVDLEVGNWYVATHPDSSFRGRLTAARTGAGLRKTLQGNRFTVHRLGTPSEHHSLSSVDDIVAVLRNEFGIRVPAQPELRLAMERLLEREQQAA
ncbi:arylamine N-acetyltransferase [Pseudoxanthomonas sp. UTMC 1351]|uniref:arylamine N-acetyltransferase n=1 Tax=Pseudoxanthomonas sp. UTMC 1351 TaxID=2695853 RepID=UPI0034CFBA6E